MRITLTKEQWRVWDSEAQRLLDHMREVAKVEGLPIVLRGNTRTNPFKRRVAEFFDSWVKLGLTRSSGALASAFWICFAECKPWDRNAHDINKRR